MSRRMVYHRKQYEQAVRKGGVDVPLPNKHVPNKPAFSPNAVSRPMKAEKAARIRARLAAK